MLTRKSLVRPACRGERPIERASCWFPPKFLLGKRPPERCAPYVTDGARVELILHAASKREGASGAGASGHGLVSRSCKAD